MLLAAVVLGACLPFAFAAPAAADVVSDVKAAAHLADVQGYRTGVDPQQLADTLVLLYDGAVATSQMDKTPEAARTARRTAELILDDAVRLPT